MKEELEFDERSLQKSALMLYAIKQQETQSILELLNNEGPLSAISICRQLRLERLKAMQHLALLQQTGLVEVITASPQISYTLNRQRLVAVIELLAAV